VARRGRKRKPGHRHPSGELVREARPDDRLRTARQPHRREVAAQDRLSERAESPLGRLNLRGVITDEQYEAGLRYCVIVGAYRSVIEAPGGGGGSGRGFSCVTQWTGSIAFCREKPGDCACTLRKARYDDAFCALMDAGQRAAKVVARVAVHREEIAHADVDALRRGLDALAKHFGLRGRRL
jgi:hypothetical protein